MLSIECCQIRVGLTGVSEIFFISAGISLVDDLVYDTGTDTEKIEPEFEVFSSSLSPTIKQLTIPYGHLEGPYWDTEKQMLYCVDMEVGYVHRYNPDTTEFTFAYIGGTVSIIIPIAKTTNKFIISKDRSLAILTWNGENTFSPEVQVITTVQPFRPLNTFNDGKVDGSGRLWIGTKAPNIKSLTIPYQANLYRFSNKTCTLIPTVRGLSISNGVTWSIKYQHMYNIDTTARQVYQYDYDLSTGTISSNRSVIVDFKREKINGDPDGMTTDSNDNLWIASFNGGQVINVNPRTREIIRLIKLPAKEVTSVMFGGPSYEVLFVTTARDDLSIAERAEEPKAGSLFAIKNLGVRGLFSPPVNECDQ